MEQAQRSSQELRTELDKALTRLNITQLTQQKSELDALIAQPDFWSNASSAQQIMQRQAKLARRLEPWNVLDAQLKDLEELIVLNDISLVDDILRQLEQLREAYELLKNELRYSGPYDDHNVIVGIYAGAGGTDAQDWAQMLMRMYIRYAEAEKMTVAIIEESAGEEAGIKSATLEICGDYAYAKLKGEHGVHRLVRLSPFNSDNLRQTSFAKVDVLPKIDSPESVEIDEKDLRIDVYRSGGHGGQSVNTTDSAVRITHIPTNIVVAIQNERSQLQNRETAMTILRSRLAQLQLEQHKEAINELKGPNEQAAWGNQIRSYVLHPYKQVKDLRTRHESSDPDGVLAGNLGSFIAAYLEYSLSLE